MESKTLPSADDLPRWSSTAVRNEFVDFARVVYDAGVVAITQDSEVEMVAMNVDIYRRIVTLAKTET